MMKKIFNDKFRIIIILSFVLNLILFSGVFAEENNVQRYNTDVVTGYDPKDFEIVIETEYKYALIELEKEFPSQLTVWLGGTVFYQTDQNGRRVLMYAEDYLTRILDVEWVCQEDYDEDLETFHFVPDIAGYEVAAGLELPVIIVNVLGELPIPPLPPLPEETHRPFVIQKDGLIEKASIPTSYNNYASGKLPPIRNQNPYGTCWSFANTVAMEADLIHDGKASASAIDLSELHLAYFTYHKFYDEKGLNNEDTIIGISGANALMVSSKRT